MALPPQLMADGSCALHLFLALQKRQSTRKIGSHLLSPLHLEVSFTPWPGGFLHPSVFSWTRFFCRLRAPHRGAAEVLHQLLAPERRGGSSNEVAACSKIETPRPCISLEVSSPFLTQGAGSFWKTGSPEERDPVFEKNDG